MKLTVCSYINQQRFLCLWKEKHGIREVTLDAAVTEHSESTLPAASHRGAVTCIWTTHVLWQKAQSCVDIHFPPSQSHRGDSHIQSSRTPSLFSITPGKDQPDNELESLPYTLK